jgi:RNA polymerase sigma factor (sigma-70 family)
MALSNRPEATPAQTDEAAELADWIAQVAKGDHSAFRKLYDRTHRKLFGVALLMLRQRDAAEDVVQEAYIRIWTRAGTYDADKGAPMAWLGRIVRNIALDRMRRKAVLTDDLDNHRHAAAAEAPVSALAVNELVACLDGLDPRHRAAWWMVHLDGLSREEVALRMHLPLGTVKSWVFRSSRRIRDAVEG